MTRVLIIRALWFTAPFALYAFYLFLARMRPVAPTHATPWAALFIAGLCLFALSFLVWDLSEGTSPKGVYVAPHVVNGKIVPGEFEPAKAKTPS